MGAGKDKIRKAIILSSRLSSTKMDRKGRLKKGAEGERGKIKNI